MWHGPMPTSMPSGILIHPAVWPKQTWAVEYCGLNRGRLVTIHMGRKLGDCAPFVGEGQLGPHLAQCGLGRGLPPYHVAS